MTTIVYHGLEKTFAMDSMVTWTSGAKQHRIENSYKIEDLTPNDIVTREGERLIALCFSGSVGQFGRCYDFILDHLHKWEERYKEIKEAGGQFLGFGTVGVILVTDKHTYTFRFTSEVAVKKHKPTAFVSAGSGSAMADTAHFVFGVAAVDAVKAASFIDEASGYMVHSLTIIDNKLVPHVPHYISDPKAEVVAMRKRAAKSTAYDMPKATTEFHKRYSHSDESRDKKLTKVREEQEKLRKQIQAEEKATGKSKRAAPRKVVEEKTTTATPPGRKRGKAGPIPARS